MKWKMATFACVLVVQSGCLATQNDLKEAMQQQQVTIKEGVDQQLNSFRSDITDDVKHSVTSALNDRFGSRDSQLMNRVELKIREMGGGAGPGGVSVNTDPLGAVVAQYRILQAANEQHAAQVAGLNEMMGNDARDRRLDEIDASLREIREDARKPNVDVTSRLDALSTQMEELQRKLDRKDVSSPIMIPSSAPSHGPILPSTPMGWLHQERLGIPTGWAPDYYGKPVLNGWYVYGYENPETAAAIMNRARYNMVMSHHTDPTVCERHMTVTRLPLR